MNKTTLTIILIVLAILIMYGVYKIDKTHCENKGGIYIWEWSSKGSKCHFKGDK